MKKQYIQLMSKALEAYSDEHIKRYFDTVKTEGLREHGFSRLTSNLGILISHGFRTHLFPLFCEMMELCCNEIPRVHAANNFSVKELILCIAEMEENRTINAETAERWRGLLKTIEPCSCYELLAKTPSDLAFNWTLFAAASEQLRQNAGLCHSEEFIELQIASQLKWLDENNMYRDAEVHPPIAYDLVARGLFALLLHFGYHGKYATRLDECLKQTGPMTLSMQSVTGELAFGGRSNQFLHNEAHLVLLLEFEANRWAKAGDRTRAGIYKSAVKRAIDHLAGWLSEPTIRHIKNRFPLESKFGCEAYGYFDKYMITVASFLYVAYLMCDETIPCVSKSSSDVFCTSDDFHKVFLKNGGYALEFDTKADPQYDASGLGRVHRVGAPSAICLSVPCPASDVAHYSLAPEHTEPLALCPGVMKDGNAQFAVTEETEYERLHVSCSEDKAAASFSCRLPCGELVKADYSVDCSGVEISVCGTGTVLHLLPAFWFDGESHTEITREDHCLTVSYRGWTCRYTTDGIVCELEGLSANRNGHYRRFTAKGTDVLKLKIEILEHTV